MKKVTIFITGISVLMFCAFVYGIKDYAKANKNNAMSELYSNNEKPNEKTDFNDIDAEDFSRKRIEESPEIKSTKMVTKESLKSKTLKAPPKKSITQEPKNLKINEPIKKLVKSTSTKNSKVNFKSFSRAPLRMIPEVKPTTAETKDSL